MEQDEQTTNTQNNVVINLEKTRSVIYQLAKKVGEYVFQRLRQAELSVDDNNKLDERLVLEWEKIIHVLCMFNVQLILKNKQEIGRDGVIRYAFFVSNGLPRPTSSFKLPARFVATFMKLDAKWRARITQNFTENKSWVGLSLPMKDFGDSTAMMMSETVVPTE